MLGELLVKYGALVGDDVFFGENVYVDRGFERFLEIGDGVVISHGVSIILHDSSLNNILGLPVKVGKTKIGKNAYIGVNTTILCGVEIGANALIGAGSLITKDIPPNTIAYGHPAKEICSVDDFRASHIENMNDPSHFFYWNVMPWRDRQRKMSPMEQDNLFSDFIYTIKEQLFNDASDCLDFGNRTIYRFLLGGWHEVEYWPPAIRWTQKKAIAYIKNSHDCECIKVSFFSELELEICLYVNKILIEKMTSGKHLWQTIEGKINSTGLLEIVIELNRTWVPDNVSKNGDMRDLGIAVNKIWIE